MTNFNRVPGSMPNDAMRSPLHHWAIYDPSIFQPPQSLEGPVVEMVADADESVARQMAQDLSTKTTSLDVLELHEGYPYQMRLPDGRIVRMAHGEQPDSGPIAPGVIYDGFSHPHPKPMP